jgi:hypothetical protein
VRSSSIAICRIVTLLNAARAILQPDRVSSLSRHSARPPERHPLSDGRCLVASSHTLANIDALASFFGVPISRMFPHAELSKSISSLLSAADGLDEADLEELTRFALFKRAATARHKTRPAHN